jgi:hypothetical protein
MTNSGMSIGNPGSRQRSLEVRYSARLLDNGDSVLLPERHSCRVVPAIFQAGESGNQDFDRRTRPYITDDATHDEVLSLTTATFR